MANKYTRWAPTQYVPLPIDYYQSALAFKEKSTQDALDKIDAILAGYGSIDPLGKDAQAKYDETTADLRARVMEASKGDLNTPASLRNINKIINDPNIADSYSKIYSHALEGAQAMKDLREYKKKNPEVNAYDYLTKFAQLGDEKGDSKKFDYTKFSSMPVLSDYYDINKRIEEGIAKLHEDTEAWKRIAEPYMIDHKETGLSKQKVREYVISQMQGDPLIKAQMHHNKRFSGYQMNPLNIDDGINKLGEAYIADKEKTLTTLQDGLAGLYEGKTDEDMKKLRAGKDDKSVVFRTVEQAILDNITTLSTFKTPNKDKMMPDEWLSPVDMVDRMEKDAIRYGFDRFAWSNTFEGREYSPAYLIRLRAQEQYNVASRLQREKTQNLINSLLDGDRYDWGPREQTPPTEDKYKDYLPTVKGLEGIILGKNGEFTKENYEDALITIDGKKYLPSDVTSEPGGGGPGDPSSLMDPMGIMSGDVYTPKPGAKPVTTEAGVNALFEKDKDRLKKYLSDHGAAENYDLSTSVGTKKAIQDIIAFNQKGESSYMPVITDVSSMSPTRISALKENINLANVYTLSGNQLNIVNDLKTARADITKKLEETKGAGVRMYPISRGGKSYDVVKVGEKDYYIEATSNIQSAFALPNAVAGELLKPGEAVRALADKNTLFFNFMGIDGQPQAGVLPNGATKEAQALLNRTYEANVNQVMKETKLSRPDAEAAINSHVRQDGGSTDMKIGNKVVKIHPVGKFNTADGNTLYYQTRTNDYIPLYSVKETLKGSIKEARSSSNKQWILENFPFLRQALQENIIFQDDQPIVPHQ